MGDAEQTQDAAGAARLDLDQAAVLDVHHQRAVQRAELERHRAAGPRCVETRIALAAVQPFAQAEIAEQRAEIVAGDAGVQARAGRGATTAPVPGDIDPTGRRARLQLHDFHAVRGRARTELGVAQRRAGDAQIVHAQIDRRDFGRIDIATGRGRRRSLRRSRCRCRARTAPVQALQSPGDAAAVGLRHQQRAGQGCAFELHAQSAAGGHDLQAGVGERGAEQQQAVGGDVGAAQRQPAAAVAAGQCDPADGVQRRRAATDDQTAGRRRFGDAVGAERGANAELALGVTGAQREPLAERQRDLALADRQLQVERGRQRRPSGLVHGRGQIQRHADQIGAQLQFRDLRGGRFCRFRRGCARGRSPCRDGDARGPARTSAHIRLEPGQVAGAVEQIVAGERRFQFGLEALAFVAHVARARAQRQPPVLTVVLRAQIVGAEAVLVVAGAPVHARERELPLRFGQAHAAQFDLAVDLGFLRCRTVQRQRQREADRRRPAGAQARQDAGVILAQRTLPDQPEQFRGVGIRVRVDTERAVAVVGNAGLEVVDADLGQHRFAGDREAVADERDVGIHVGGRRPIGVEFHAHVLQRGAGVEHTGRHRAGR